MGFVRGFAIISFFVVEIKSEVFNIHFSKAFQYYSSSPPFLTINSAGIFNTCSRTSAASNDCEDLTDVASCPEVNTGCSGGYIHNEFSCIQTLRDAFCECGGGIKTGISDFTFHRRSNSHTEINQTIAVQEITEHCGWRLRLTHASPKKTGCAWWHDSVHVASGFETEFNITLSDVAVGCKAIHAMDTSHTHHHTLCTQQATDNHTVSLSGGGDGFAFVVRGLAGTSVDDAATQCGRDGRGLGFAGLSNTLAIAFFTLPKAGMSSQHVCVISGGFEAVDVEGKDDLSVCVPIKLWEGISNIIKIKFELGMVATSLNVLKTTEYSREFVGSSAGTITVYMDEVPILATVTDMRRLLALSNDHALIGLTAATGDHFQNVDISSWRLCTPTCS